MDAEIANALRSATPLQSLSRAELPRARARLASLPHIPTTLAAAVEAVDLVAGGDGSHPVRVRLIRPRGTNQHALPGLMWMHGGGYVVGTHRQDEPMLMRWSAEHRCAIISVDYRLAPEHPYPAGLDDCAAVFAWALGSGSVLGIDPSRLGVGGFSAGGGLAAALALRSRGRGETPPAFQLLMAPMIDDRMATESSRRPVLVWPPALNAWAWRAYLGSAGEDGVPETAAPARATDLTDLPPALVVASSLDGLLDEGIDYAMRLNRAGVDAELHLHPGAPHGFQASAPDSRLTRRALAMIDMWLSRHLHVGE